MAKMTEAKAKQAYEFIDAEDTMEGFEQIDSSTMAVPFLVILQQGSPQLNKEKPQFLPDAEVGEWFNTVTKKTYGQSVNVIALKFEHMYIEWLPDRGGLVSYHTPERAAQLADDTTFGKWKTVNGNDLSEGYSYIIIIEDHEDDGIMVLSLGSTAIKAAREWNRLMTSHIMDNGEKAKPYYLVWNVTTEYTENDKGNWYTPIITFYDYVTKTLSLKAKEERKALPDKTIDYKQLEVTSETQLDEDTEF